MTNTRRTRRSARERREGGRRRKRNAESVGCLERRIARARRREYQVLARAPDFFIGVYQRVVVVRASGVCHHNHRLTVWPYRRCGFAIVTTTSHDASASSASVVRVHRAVLSKDDDRVGRSRHRRRDAEVDAARRRARSASSAMDGVSRRWAVDGYLSDRTPFINTMVCIVYWDRGRPCMCRFVSIVGTVALSQH